MDSLLFLGGIEDSLFIVDISNPKQPKQKKMLKEMFKCGGLNNCFDVRKDNQTAIGYKKSNEIKELNLSKNYKVNKHRSEFDDSYVFKYFFKKKTILIANCNCIFEHDIDSFRLKRKKKFNKSDPILMDHSKDEEYIFVTTNGNKFFILKYDKLEIVRIIKVKQRFVTLSFPEKSPFIFGSLDSALSIQYGKPEHFIKGFKT